MLPLPGIEPLKPGIHLTFEPLCFSGELRLVSKIKSVLKNKSGHPTQHFTILEPQYLAIHVSEQNKFLELADLDVLKLQHVWSGTTSSP